MGVLLSSYPPPSVVLCLKFSIRSTCLYYLMHACYVHVITVALPVQDEEALSDIQGVA